MQSPWVIVQYSSKSLGAVSPPVASGQMPGGGAGGEAPQALRMLYFTVPEKGLKTRIKRHHNMVKSYQSYVCL